MQQGDEGNAGNKAGMGLSSSSSAANRKLSGVSPTIRSLHVINC